MLNPSLVASSHFARKTGNTCMITSTAPFATNAIRPDRPGTVVFADNVTTMEMTSRAIVAEDFH